MKKRFLTLTLTVMLMCVCGLFACEDGDNSLSNRGNSTSAEQDTGDGLSSSAESSNSSDSSDNSSNTSSHEHDYIVVIATPTCTEQGFTTHTCECGDSYVDTYVNALEHDFVDYVSNNDATCTEDGTETATCSRQGCEETDTRTEENSASGHEFTNYISDNNATCTANGTETASCNHTGCQETDTRARVNSALGHDYSEATYEWNENQCTATRVCGRDNAHKETETVTEAYVKDTDATCTAPEKGHHEAMFKNPAFVKQETDANSVTKGVELGHSYTNYVLDNNATCTEDGTETAVCNRDGCEETDIRTAENSKLGFNYGEPEYIWNGNKCTAKRVCVNRCNHIETETVIAEYIKDTDANSETSEKGHYEVAFENQAFEMQQTEASSVTVCEALGHSFTNYVYNDDAKCEVNGTETATCGRLCCDATDTREKLNSALEHNHQKTEKVIYCTLSGEYQLYRCSLCSKEKQELINAQVDSHSLPDVHNLLSVGDICQYCSGEILAKSGDSLVIKLGDIYQVEHYAGTTVRFINYANVINSAYISNNVTEIGNSSFQNHIVLTELKVPQSATLISGGAFGGCSALKKITIPFVGGSATENSARESTLFGYIFGTSAYTGGTATEQYYASGFSKTYYIPSSLKSVTVTGGNILYGSFYNCKGLTSITIGDGVRSIANNAFYNCAVLREIYYNATECADFGSGNDVFGNAGKNGDGITVTIGANVKKIPTYLFFSNNINNYAPKIATVVFEEGSVCESIGGWAFAYCDSLTSVVIGDSVTSIGDNAFKYCGSLTSVVIGDSVTSIGYDAFNNCSSLTSIEIPDSVTSIGSYAFEDCYRLVEVVNKSSLTITKGSSSNGYVGYYALAVYNSGDAFTSKLSNDNGYIIYTDGTEKILVGYSGTETGLILPSYITQINDHAFYKRDSLKSVVIPDSVTSIGSEAFYSCDSLKSIEIPESVKSIGKEVLRGCSSLTEITLSFGWAKGDLKHKPFGYLFGASSYLFNADYVPTSLKKVTITGGFIGDSAFEGCDSLTSVVIGDSVTSIGNEAFFCCDSLTNVYITDIAAWCSISFGTSFANPLVHAKNLYLNNKLVTELEIPNTVAGINGHTFEGCDSLTSVMIGDSVTSIGDFAFQNCRSLTSVMIGDSVTSIGDFAFQNCRSLTSVVIGDGVTSIRNYAFDDCRSLTSIEIPDSVTSIGNCAFQNCRSLTSVVIGDSVTSIGYGAFYGCGSLKSIEIPDSVVLIGNYAFQNCDSLTSITFKDTSTWYRTSSSTNWAKKTGGTKTSVTTPSTNATYFKSTYYNHYWYKL